VSAPFAPPTLVAWHATHPGPATAVHLADVTLGPGIVAALAVLGDDPPEIRVHRGGAWLDRV
jgi:hypothetical protein